MRARAVAGRVKVGGRKGVSVKNAVLSTPAAKTIGTIQDSSLIHSNEEEEEEKGGGGSSEWCEWLA